jgi:hypothetical protein
MHFVVGIFIDVYYPAIDTVKLAHLKEVRHQSFFSVANVLALLQASPSSPPARKKRRKSKMEGAEEGKKEKLYCVCKTKYDNSK